MGDSGVVRSATHPRNVQKLHKNSTNISGTAEDLQRRLKELEQDIRDDLKGKKEYEDYLTKLNIQKADLQQRMTKNRDWIDTFERNQDGGAFEAQYKKLLDDIKQIYNGAKEFHAKGIEMLIKVFDYHVTYKRWSDKFTAIPFTPQ